MKRWLIYLFCAVNSFAEGQIVTDRPSQSNGPSVVDRGTFQMESGINYTEVNGFSHGVWTLPKNLFRIGLGKGIELRTANGLQVRATSFGTLVEFFPFELGLKFQLLNREETKTKIGLVVHGFTTAGINQGNSGRRGGNATLAVQHRLNEKHALLYNLKYSLSSVGDIQNGYLVHEGFASLVYSVSLGERIGLFAECYGGVIDFTLLTSQSYHCNVDLGFTASLRPNLQLDYSFGFGILDRFNFQEIGISFCVPSKTK